MTRNTERNALILREAKFFAAEVKKIFGDDLVRAFLFGTDGHAACRRSKRPTTNALLRRRVRVVCLSCATGTNHADSDVDVALILDGVLLVDGG